MVGTVLFLLVIPAQAGIQFCAFFASGKNWIPGSACGGPGMTVLCNMHAFAF